ncbi:MAG TPA: F0F1 ATP synthase subunit epsilon [Anaerolineae bacterium]|nr:F0F1 ATP synthase subunit epsilon [Anaerolineae bacterium]HOR00734.1 F0F1 ATP synthase subunit epsilon [Anaerolineae bacterium]
MAQIRVEIVTMERQVYAGDADIVLAPGLVGQLGILPKHAPLITRLGCGELVVRKGGDEEAFAIGGGFMEVLPDRVVVLADSAEGAAEIDVQRAEAARQRAAQLKRQRLDRTDLVQVEAALRRSLARLQVARRRAPRAQAAGRESFDD